MKPKAKVLMACSLLLFTSGSNFFVKSEVGRRIRCLFRILFVIVSCFFAYLTFVFWRSFGLSLTFLSFAAYSCGFVSCYVVLILRRKSCESLMRQIMRRVTQTDLHRVWKEAVVLLVLTSVLWVYDYVVALTSWSRSDASYYVNSVTEALTPNWIMVTCSFYVIVFRLLSFYQIRIMQNAIRSATNEPRKLDVIQITARLIRDSNDEFDRLFSLMPFMWFAHGIISTPSYVSYLRSSLSLLPMISTSVFAPIVVVMVISCVQSSMDRLLMEAKDLIARNQVIASSEKLLLLRDLNLLKEIRFTGLSFFQLDKSFVLAYSGSVVTFSALIATYANNN